MTKNTPTTPAESQPTEAAPGSPYYGVYGHYWKSNRDVPPTKWLRIRSSALVMSTSQANGRWNTRSLQFLPCAYKCPYCPKFDNLETTTPQVVKLRAHIKRDHLVRLSVVDGLRYTDIYQKKKPHDFLGLSVTPGRVTKPRTP
ncbi:hypothetical protein N7536_007747 [Penicillium majusculum]|nr:hypothetical protein N7536_007747 [Penicillium majusculum]